MRGFPAEDLSGRTFGLWTVLERATDARKGGTMWQCQCDSTRGGCGAVHAVAANTLKGGHSTGCLRCAAVRRHRNNPELSAHLAGLSAPTWSHRCQTCRKWFKGTSSQRFCSRACWPCRRK